MPLSNTLYYGDNLKWLRQLHDESVDLVYLDPPFNSSRTYNLLFKQQKGEDSPAQIMAFEDTWRWSNVLYEEFRADPENVPLLALVESLINLLGRSEVMAYVLMMAPRLMELHRILKPTGSLYLHCDPAASPYLRLVLDVIFGGQYFKNELIWKRTSAHSSAKRYGPVHDVILFYTRSDKFTWNPQYTPYDESYTTQFYRHAGEDGRRYTLGDLTGSGTRNGETGKTWRNVDVTARGRHWMVPPTELDKLDAEGMIYWPPKGGMPRLKRYLDTMQGVPLQDVFTDISPIGAHAHERRGYPTQKPLALLERFIAASSNEGDIVLDPFCGCGTAVIAAERMNRRWLGIDITYLAIAEVIYRLETENIEGKIASYRIMGVPTDEYSARQFFISTAKQNHKPFEMWAVSLVQGEPIEKKGGDRGIDGRLPLFDNTGKLRWAVIQVKGGHLSPSLIRDFARVVERENAPMGMFISLEKPTDAMRREAEELGVIETFGARRIPRLQMLTIKEMLEEKIQFLIPEGYRRQRQEGVGRLMPQQGELGYEMPSLPQKRKRR